MVAFARAYGLRASFYTLSSGRFGSDHQQILLDLKRRWSLFIQSTVWRKVLCAAWVFGDHERPHIHLVAVLPPDLPVHAIRNRWDAGFSNAKPVDLVNYARLGSYLAAQGDLAARKTRARHRYFGVKRLKGGA